MNLKRLAEVTVISLLFMLAMQTLIGNLAGPAALSLDAVLAGRIALLAAAVLTFGYWVERRLSPGFIEGSLAFVVAVVAVIWKTVRGHDLGNPASIEEWGFILGLIAIAWDIFFVGAYLASRRGGPNPAA
jgi:uncharacterized membrane protein